MTQVAIDQGPETRLTAQKTLEDMRLRVLQQVPIPLIWEKARDIVASITPRDEVAQAKAIRDWCERHFRFVNDPLWHQLLTTPLYLLEKIQRQGFVQGNCADAAMLTASLCEGIHIPCAFIAVAFNDPKAPYSHVFTFAYPRESTGSRATVEMDITRPPQVTHAHFTRRLKVEV